MRILWWVPQFRPYIGGIEVLAAHVLPALVARGHEPAVITSHGALDLPDDEIWEGIPVHRLPFSAALASGDAGQVVEVVAAVARLKRDLAPEVVQVNLSDPSAFFHLRTQAAHAVPTVLSVQVTVGRGGASSLLADLLRRADAVTGVSEACLRAAIRACPEIEPRARVILNALPPIEPPTAAPQPGLLVAAGRLVGDKGFDVAVRALARVREHHPDAVLRIAGDGPARDDLLALAGRLGVRDAVELLGWVAPERMAEVLAEAAVVLVPSRWEEAFGLVALEGMQVGRPVVASAVGGIPEVVGDDRTGRLVSADDADALAAAVAPLLDDPLSADALGAAGRHRADSVFSFTRYVDEHVDLYEALVSR